MVSVGIRLYPGTPLAAQLAQAGRLDPSAALLEPVFYQPDSLPLPAILDTCRQACPAHWFFPGLKSDRRDEQMRALRRRGVKGPLWDYLNPATAK